MLLKPRTHLGSAGSRRRSGEPASWPGSGDPTWGRSHRSHTVPAQGVALKGCHVPRCCSSAAPTPARPVGSSRMLQPFWGEPRGPGCGHTTPPRHSKPGWSSEPGAADRGDATALGLRAQGKAAPPWPPTGAAPCITPGPPSSHSTWGRSTATSRCPPVPGAAVEAGLLHGIDGVAQELVRVLLAAEAEMPGDLCRDTAVSPRPPAATSTPPARPRQARAGCRGSPTWCWGTRSAP